MRYSDCNRVAEALLPQLPGFVTNKKCDLFIAPIGHVWRGFLFESTAWAREDFYFWWFFMPITIPTDFMHLNYGERLNVSGSHAGWRTDVADLPGMLMAAMKPKALPILHSIHSYRDTIEAIYFQHGKDATNIHVLDDIACLQILDGQFDPALATLDLIIAMEHGTDRRQWILDIVDRMKGLRAKLVEDPELAVMQVKQWQDFTYKALKLEKWR
ncbi:MAG: hypothetical protein WAT70_05835 [Rhizobiaceae bacterium]